MTSALTCRKNSRGLLKGCALQLAPSPELNAPDAPPSPPDQELSHELQKVSFLAALCHELNQELCRVSEAPAAVDHEESQELQKLLWAAPGHEASHELNGALCWAPGHEASHEPSALLGAAAPGHEESHELNAALCCAPGHEESHEANAPTSAPPSHELSHELVSPDSTAVCHEASHELKLKPMPLKRLATPPVISVGSNPLEASLKS